MYFINYTLTLVLIIITHFKRVLPSRWRDSGHLSFLPRLFCVRFNRTESVFIVKKMVYIFTTQTTGIQHSERVTHL